jgi:hypothetical protein
MVEDALREIVGDDELQRAGDDALTVHTSETAESLRDRLAEAIDGDEGLLVIEFEKWSSYGKAVDAIWLLARGH